MHTVGREEGLWPNRSPRPTEVYSAALADINEKGSPTKLRVQSTSNSNSRNSSPARWNPAGAPGSATPLPVLQHSASSNISSPKGSLRQLSNSSNHSNSGRDYHISHNNEDADSSQQGLVAQAAQRHRYPQQHAPAGNALAGQGSHSGYFGNRGSNATTIGQPGSSIRESAVVDSPGRPRRAISAPGSHLHNFAVQQATIQHQQQQGAGDNSPQPQQFSSLAARLGNNSNYHNLPLDVSLDGGHGTNALCDTPDSNCSAHSASSNMQESPHQPTATRFKPRPPGNSNGGSASSTPHSISATGGQSSGGGASTGSTTGGGTGSLLLPHPPQSCRKKPTSAGAAGCMGALPECGSPQVYGLPGYMESPLPTAGGALVSALSDPPGSGSIMLRRRTYSHSAQHPGSGGSGSGSSIFSPLPTLLRGNSSSGYNGNSANSNSGHFAVIEGSLPSSPQGAHKTGTSGGGFLYLNTADSSSLGDSTLADPGRASHVGGTNSSSTTVGLGGSSINTSREPMASTPHGTVSNSQTSLASSAAGHSPNALTHGSSSAGSGGSFSRPSSGRGCKTVCLLVDAVRSRDDGQLEANLAYCTGGVHGLNDRHPIYDRTPLHEAVCLGSPTMVQMLLTAGSDANLGHPKEGGPLLQAAAVGAADIVELLLDAGADVGGVDVQGRTALHHACRSGHVGTARLLLSKGADLSARTVEGETPLDMARREVQLSLCGAGVSPTAASADGFQRQLSASAAGASLPGTPGSSGSSREQHANMFRSNSSSDTMVATGTTAGPSNGGLCRSFSSGGITDGSSLINVGRSSSSASGSLGANQDSSSIGGPLSNVSSICTSGNLQMRRSSSSSGGHSLGPFGTATSGGLLSSLASGAPAVHGNSGEQTATGQNLIMGSASTALLSASSVASNGSAGGGAGSSGGAGAGGGHGTPPISPSSLADAGQTGMRRPSPPVPLMQRDSGSSGGIRAGRSGLIINTDSVSGESSTAVDPQPDERAPTPPVLQLPERLVNVRKQRLRNKGVGLEDIQRGLQEDDQSFLHASHQQGLTHAEEAAKQAAACALRTLSLKDFNPPQPALARHGSYGNYHISSGGSSTSSLNPASSSRAGSSAQGIPGDTPGFGAMTTTSSGELSRSSATPSSTTSPGLDALMLPPPGFRSPLASSSSHCQQQQFQQPQHLQPQAGPPVFKFGIDLDSQSMRVAVEAAAAAAAAAIAAKHQQQDGSSANDATTSSSSSHLGSTFRLRLADSIPRQFAALTQQHGQSPQQPQQQKNFKPFLKTVVEKMQSYIGNGSQNQQQQQAPEEAAEQQHSRNSSISEQQEGKGSSMLEQQNSQSSSMSEHPQTQLLQQQQQGQQTESRVPALLQHNSLPISPGTVSLARVAGRQTAIHQPQPTPTRQPANQQQQQQAAAATRQSVDQQQQPVIPAAGALLDDGPDAVSTSAEAIGLRAAKMFGHCEDLQMGNIQWTKGELLGEGAYGKVFAGLNQETGELMAVKALQLMGRSGSAEANAQLKELSQELELYKKLKHTHIVGYIDARFERAANTLYIFLEYVPGGSIASMLQRFGQFNEQVARKFTRQLLLGLDYLHKEQIVHRDLKGGNALVTRDGVVKLADFGASKPFANAKQTDMMKSLRGSAFWMAPEVLKGKGYGRKADIWSLACTVVEMLTGKHPWPDLDNQWTALLAISQTTTGPPRPAGISAAANDFLDHCFKTDPKERSSASQLLMHPWVAPTGLNRTKATFSDEG